ncbi:MAG: hypothetical protein CMA88_01675 [Euryarchaeota archaeon]|nr:hypothetical protein [Euryarchaeota archaeon]
MGLHGGSWRVHASSVDDLELITDSVKWLCGEEDAVSVNKGKSALGATMHTIMCKMGAKHAKHSLGRIDGDSLSSILDSIGSLIDEDKILHIRLDLGRLVMGEGRVVRENCGTVAKGRFKLEVYPGQDPASVATELIEDLLE